MGIEDGNTVTVHYEGTLDDGTVEITWSLNWARDN